MKTSTILLTIGGIVLLITSIIFCSLYSVANRNAENSFEYYFNTITITLLLIFFGMLSIFGAVKNSGFLSKGE